jgi:hypothetical protein
VTAPHYSGENKSDMRGIKPGWYAIEDDGNLSSGPFSSREECVKKNHSADKRDDAVQVEIGPDRNTSLSTGVWG